MTPEPWQTRSRRTVLDLSPWLQVESHEVELPDGRVIDDWPWLVTREYVNVVPLTPEGHFLVFRQTKYATRRVQGDVVGDGGRAGARAARGSSMRDRLDVLVSGPPASGKSTVAPAG